MITPIARDTTAVPVMRPVTPKGRPTATGAVLELASVEQAVVEIEFSNPPAAETELTGLDYDQAVAWQEENK